MDKQEQQAAAGIRLAVRLARGQGELARRIGVSQQAVSSWEKQGWAPLKRCDEIAQLTGVPARDLMDPRVRAMVEQVAAR